eukprot:785335-Prorocentrum_lima.AAC.1
MDLTRDSSPALFWKGLQAAGDHQERPGGSTPTPAAAPEPQCGTGTISGGEERGGVGCPPAAATTNASSRTASPYPAT